MHATKTFDGCSPSLSRSLWQVCNTCRRAVTIVAAAIIFQNALSPASAGGVVLIIGGSIAYAVAMARAKASAPSAVSPQQEEVQAEVDALLDVDGRSEPESEPAAARSGMR